jgi:hypothetical protein
VSGGSSFPWTWIAVGVLVAAALASGGSLLYRLRVPR